MSFAFCNRRLLSLFRKTLVSIYTLPPLLCEDMLYSPPTAGVLLSLEPWDCIHNLSTLVSLAAPIITELVLGIDLPRWVEPYIPYFRNLRKLSLSCVTSTYPLDKMLSACSRTLTHLQIVTDIGEALSQNQINALATHACSVDTFILRLSIFRHDWAPMWKAMGPRLRYLSLGATHSWMMGNDEIKLLQLISRYCVHIQHLHFFHLGPTLGNACANLCARYGSQLRRIEFAQCHLQRADLVILADKCESVNVTVSHIHDSRSINENYNCDVIELLGNQIDVLKYQTRLAYDDSLAKVARKCSSLRALHLDFAGFVQQSVLQSIIERNASTLNSVSLKFYGRIARGATVSSALDALAENAIVLETVDIGVSRLHIASWTHLIERCKHTLRNISITFEYEGDSVEVDTLFAIIRKLYVCETLQFLLLNNLTMSHKFNSGAIRQALDPLRRRLEHVHIFDCGA